MKKGNKQDSDNPNNRLKYWLLGVGIVTTLIGAMCLPLGQGASPEGGTSFFATGAVTGAFLKYAFWIMAFGVVIMICSLLIRMNIKKAIAREVLIFLGFVLVFLPYRKDSNELLIIPLLLYPMYLIFRFVEWARKRYQGKVLKKK